MGSRLGTPFLSVRVRKILRRCAKRSWNSRCRTVRSRSSAAALRCARAAPLTAKLAWPCCHRRQAAPRQPRNKPWCAHAHAFSTRLQAAIGSLRVPPDSGEAVEVLELIKSLPIEGRRHGRCSLHLSLHCGGDQKTRRRRGSFLFVKANQPDLQSELAQLRRYSPLRGSSRRSGDARWPAGIPPISNARGPSKKRTAASKRARLPCALNLLSRLDQNWQEFLRPREGRADAGLAAKTGHASVRWLGLIPRGLSPSLLETVPGSGILSWHEHAYSRSDHTSQPARTAGPDQRAMG